MLGLFFALLMGDSITLSPVGVTMHLIAVPESISSKMPRKVNGNSKFPLVIHPEFNLTYKQKWMQYSATYLRDCYDKNAGALMFGPKWDVLDRYLSVGLIAGGYIREQLKELNQNEIPFTHSFGSVQIMPIGGITTSFTIPLSKNLGIETNVIANPALIHSVTGLKLNW